MEIPVGRPSSPHSCPQPSDAFPPGFCTDAAALREAHLPAFLQKSLLEVVGYQAGLHTLSHPLYRDVNIYTTLQPTRASPFHILEL